MKISIIIPSYRQPQFLGRAIESCLEQDHTDIEVIVVEDRSRDASLGVALSFDDDQVKVIECEHNGGLGAARNIGVSAATGEYLCFLDSDDYLLDRSLSSRIEALPAAVAEHGEHVVGVYGDWQHVSEFVDYPKVRAARTAMPLVHAESYTGENAFICSAPIVRRDAVIAAGGFPEGLPMLEDFAMWAKIIAAGGIFVPVHHVVATYRQRPNSMLRGDGVVVMAEHVDIINRWMTDADVPLADGGAMEAWLEGRTPYSFGRMSWNVPSVLGSFGGAAGANAVHASEQLESQDQLAGLDDFMTNPDSGALERSPTFWTNQAFDAPTSLVLVHSVRDCLDALAITREMSTAAIAAVDPLDWTVTWPLALAGVQAFRLDDFPGTAIIDLASTEQRFATRTDLTEKGVALVWPQQPARRGSIVYVPESLSGYPALDAWISTSLHALAEAGHEPTLMCDPTMRSQLGGYRSTLLSVDSLRASALVVSPVGSHAGLVEALAPHVVFAPSSVDGDHPRTRAELDDAIARSVGDV